MKLQRCQFGEVKEPGDFRHDPSGACGPGIYAMKFGDKKLRKHYSARGEKTYAFEVPDDCVKEIKGRGLTYYQAIKEAIEMHKGSRYKVFVCKHKGIGIPESKQIVITDASIITNIELI